MLPRATRTTKILGNISAYICNPRTAGYDHCRPWLSLMPPGTFAHQLPVAFLPLFNQPNLVLLLLFPLLGRLTPDLSLARFWPSFRPVASIERGHLISDLESAHMHMLCSLSRHLFYLHSAFHCVSLSYFHIWWLSVPEKWKHDKAKIWLPF